MKLLLVGHGKMGRMVESLARDYGFDVAGVMDPMSPAHGGGPDDPAWTGVDVAIDFSTPGTPIDLFRDEVPISSGTINRVSAVVTAGNRMYAAAGDLQGHICAAR